MSDIPPQVPMAQHDLVSAALAACQGELKAAEFDATNPFFKSKYATLGAVIAASREALAKNGLAILQIPRIENNQVSVETRIIHKSGQWLFGGCMSLPLEGNDRNSDAQVAGSILTYLKRYAWSAVLGIYADTDDDANSAPKGAIPRQNVPQASKPSPHTTQASKQGSGGTQEAGKPLSADSGTRLRALNVLQAAPGQPNRQLVKDYLTAQGWITLEQQPEDWDLKHVPLTQGQMRELGAAVAEFQHEQRGPGEPAP